MHLLHIHYTYTAQKLYINYTYTTHTSNTLHKHYTSTIQYSPCAPPAIPPAADKEYKQTNTLNNSIMECHH